MLGFEPLVNQRLLPPSFPRYVSVFGREAVSTHVALNSLSSILVVRFHLILNIYILFLAGHGLFTSGHQEADTCLWCRGILSFTYDYRKHCFMIFLILNHGYDFI